MRFQLLLREQMFVEPVACYRTSTNSVICMINSRSSPNHNYYSKLFRSSSISTKSSSPSTTMHLYLGQVDRFHFHQCSQHIQVIIVVFSPKMEMRFKLPSEHSNGFREEENSFGCSNEQLIIVVFRHLISY